MSRALALAEILVETYDCLFLTQEPNETIRKEIKAVCPNLTELPKSSDFPAEASMIAKEYLTGREIVVLDGYNFATEYQNRLRYKGSKLVCIDDIHLWPFVADVVINHAGGIQREQYKIAPFTKLCLGTSFTMLRQSFLKTPTQNRLVTSINSVFICFGSVDNKNYTLKTLEAYMELKLSNEIHVVIGSSYSHEEQLAGIIDQAVNNQINIRLYRNLLNTQMIEVIESCQIAICSPSIMAYEACSIGIGLICIQSEENQKNMTNFIAKSACGLTMEKFEIETLINSIEELSVPQINKQIEKQKEHFSDSSSQLKKIFDKLALELELEIRPANPDDLLTYFNWANDPLVRNNSINQNEIPLSDHTKWFDKKMSNSSSLLFLVEKGGAAIGQVRFEYEDGSYLINYSVAEEYRGVGVGEVMLKMAIARLHEEISEVPQLCGFVKAENTVSSSAFINNSFTEAGTKQIEGVSYKEYKK